MDANAPTREGPPQWEAFLARLESLTDPFAIRGAHIEYLQTLFADCRVEFTPRELRALAGAKMRWLPTTEAYRLEGLPIQGESALVDDMVLISGPLEGFAKRHFPWLENVRLAVLQHLSRVRQLPPDPDQHPVTRLSREPLFHHCVQALSRESQLVFHGLFLSIEGFPGRWPGHCAQRLGDDFLCEVAALLRDTHPPRTALFHLSQAFFAALSTGPSRREYRKTVWELRNLLLRRGFLPNSRLEIAAAVISWPTDACFPGPFCDLLLCSLNKARRKKGNSVIFTEDWYRNPFDR